MNLHEYQAKQLFAQHGVPVPAGAVARTVAEAREVARELGGGPWVVKAQVHAGGRGKAGGVKLVRSHEAVKEAVNALLGKQLVTYQNAP
ncbi:MAG: acetate--CoA ligase family protein, partial [Gammaproteobacteria bacterium]|nr:acetate--CoA ligase family protein [Gammaproteobacteria bacterium]